MNYNEMRDLETEAFPELNTKSLSEKLEHAIMKDGFFLLRKNSFLKVQR